MTALWMITFSLLGSAGAVSIAALLLLVKGSRLRRMTSALIPYAIGTLLGAAFFGMIPHALSHLPSDTVLPTVLGGISVNGGKGKVVNVFVGACIMGVLANGMTMLNINQYLQWIINGLVLLFAVTMSNLRKSSS